MYCAPYGGTKQLVGIQMSPNFAENTVHSLEDWSEKVTFVRTGREDS